MKHGDESNLPGQAKGIQPEHLFAISQCVTQAHEWKPALDEVVKLVRTIFIFDNLVVYIYDQSTKNLDVMYAKAIGRGRFTEGDIAWGESLANRITESPQTILQEPEGHLKRNRLDNPFLLGVPLATGKAYLGAIIFVRFGGPKYTPENLQLAQFIGQQIARLVEHQSLQYEYDQLSEQRHQVQLQEAFISTISHELRSPLGFIKGYTTTLLRTDTSWDEATRQEFLEIIDQETDHLQELIANLLDSARLQSGQLPLVFQRVLLDSLIKDTINRAKLHHPSLQVNLEKPRRLLPIMGDPSRLAQVFENLISNAIKYAPDSDLLVKIIQEEQWVHISVTDQGPGIPIEFQGHLFERFYRVPGQSPSKHGTGLGLYICKLIIQGHQGNIAVESSPNQGTTFHIKLPYDPRPAEQGS